jgi:hypothetical protein
MLFNPPPPTRADGEVEMESGRFSTIDGGMEFDLDILFNRGPSGDAPGQASRTITKPKGFLSAMTPVPPSPYSSKAQNDDTGNDEYNIESYMF